MITNIENASFSIIVPVYNDEQNISRCLTSITSQTYTNYECIVVDDGSNDSTPSITDKFAAKYPNIFVFHNTNMGIGGARQFGLSKVKNHYTVFIDSDDWVDPGFLYHVNNNLSINPSDILFTDFYSENTKKIERHVSQRPPSLQVETVTMLVLEGKILSCLWNVVIRRDFYLQNNINFSKTINYGEDSLFILEFLLNSPDIGYIEKACYHHTFNNNSYTRNRKKKRYMERTCFITELQRLLEKYNRTDLNKYNFFPPNDKFEMLCSGIFSKKEYQNLFPISVDSFYLKESGFIKYILLITAETNIYFLAKIMAIFFLRLKNLLFSVKKVQKRI